MSLEPNQQLSNYRLVEKIGEGGMGVVWKARDTTLGRDVAIKVLPDHLAADADRMARFEREARLLASLNHSGIATIHGLHESGGVRFLAMELAAGTDLAHRLAAGQLSLEEALGIGLQIASALEAAHDSGVVHRDLKPANIQVGPDGSTKILDFGLAKAFEGDPSSPASSLSPTLTTPATRAGIVLGTAAYMSPEQAKGKVVDRRADIWAFGCVIYEMLVGQRPFTGDGVSETLAAVIMSPADHERLPATTPTAIRRPLRRCLEKDPRRRLRDIGEARIALEDLLAGKTEEPAAATSGAADPAVAPRRGGVPLLAGLAILGAAAGALVMWSLAPGPRPTPLRRFEMPAEGPFRSSLAGRLLAISPDGRRVAHVEKGRLRIRQLDRLESKEVDTPVEPVLLFWSPDSAWLGYVAGGKLWKVPAEGGQGIVIADHPGVFTGGSGASWGGDGRIVLSRGDGGVMEIPARGGDLKEILSLDPNAESDMHQPELLPDGAGILVVPHAQGGRPDHLILWKEGRRKELLRFDGQDIAFPTWSPTGHILYRRQPVNAGIWALPFSLREGEATGEPFLVVPDGDVPSVSADGTLVYAPGATPRMAQLAWLDRSGKHLGTVGGPQEGWPFPALSPDGNRAAIAAAEADQYEVWLHDLERKTRSRLTFSANARYAIPYWFPEGDRILYDSGSGAPFSSRVIPADGGGDPVEVAAGWGSSLSPDGRYLLYSSIDPVTNFDIWMKKLGPDGEPIALVKGEGIQIYPRVSPDGRYVAYLSDENGEPAIFLKRFPSGEGRWQVSTAGGFWPKWSARGDRLYYVNGDTILEVETDLTGEAPRLGNPVAALTRPPLGSALMFNWPPGFDVSADGQRFLVSVGVGSEESSHAYLLVQNWLQEFQAGR